MKRLHACAVCGFLSTLGSEFTRLEGLTVDKECAEHIKDGTSSAAKWFASAKARAAAKAVAP